jgi:hypothetical protein
MHSFVDICVIKAGFFNFFIFSGFSFNLHIYRIYRAQFSIELKAAFQKNMKWNIIDRERENLFRSFVWTIIGFQMDANEFFPDD